jgi:hypothetical protein
VGGVWADAIPEVVLKKGGSWLVGAAKLADTYFNRFFYRLVKLLLGPLGFESAFLAVPLAYAQILALINEFSGPFPISELCPFW